MKLHEHTSKVGLFNQPDLFSAKHAKEQNKFRDDTCKHCNTPFTTNHSHKKYCGLECQKAARRERLKNVSKRPCQYHGCNELYPMTSSMRKFCDYHMDRKNQRKRIDKPCKFNGCNDTFNDTIKGQRRYCDYHQIPMNRYIRISNKQIPCKGCGEIFTSINAKLYCNIKCRDKSRHQRRRQITLNKKPPREITCKYCNMKSKTRIQNKKFCNEYCQQQFHRNKNRKPVKTEPCKKVDCNNTFQKNGNSNRVYCDEHKNNVSDSALKRKVRIRDNNTCQWKDNPNGPICGNTIDDGIKIEIDHIIAIINGGQNVKQNMRCLCRYHHNIKSNLDRQIRLSDNIKSSDFPFPSNNP